MTVARATWMHSNVLVLAGVAVVLAACGDASNAVVDAPVVAASVELAPSTQQALTVGDTVQLAAVVKDAGGVTLDHPVAWSSDNETIAQVSTSGLVTAWGAGSASVSATSDGASASMPVAVSAAAPISIAITGVIGKDTLPEGDTPQGGQGEPVNGISCLGMEQVAYHIHAHLSLFVHGEQLAIPLGVGVVSPQVTDGFVGSGSCFYWLHTHDATGIIHVESPKTSPLTLGDLFDVWGQPLSAIAVAGFDGPVAVFVDGARYRGDPRAIAFTERMQITLEVGTPLVPPPVYEFPSVY